MKSTGFIAKRYLFSRKSISLISTLTAISVIGVTIGTAVLIVVLSIFNGFFEVIKGLLLSNDPHLRIELAEGETFQYSRQMKSELEGIPEIRIISPYVSGKTLMTTGKNRNKIVSIKGIDAQSFRKMDKLEKNVNNGALNLSVQNQTAGVLVSTRLMAEMGLQIGSEVVLLSAAGMQNALTQFSLPRTSRLELRGTYSITQIIEQTPVYISLEAAQRLFDYRDAITGIDMRLQNSNEAETVKTMLQNRLGDRYEIATWYELKKPLYDVMRLEKWGAYFILMIVVLVAVLNIIGSLTMIVIQKNRDIGLLLTMGFTANDIKQIFLKQGLFIGMIGCGLGGALGLLFSWLQKEYGLIKLSSSFIIDAYPVSIHALDIVLILAGSLLLCMLASWYPAKRAATVEPADAIRFE